MARQIGPTQAERVFLQTSGSRKGLPADVGTPVPLYSDTQCSLPADVLGLSGESLIGSGAIPQVAVGDTLECALFQFPDVADPVVYTRVLGGPVVALHPSDDGRMDLLAADIVTAQAAATSAALVASKRVARSAQGALTISWDDGFSEIYTNLWPRLRDVYTTQDHTIAITPGLLNNVNGLYMTTAQVQEIADSRHEIACHSQTHADIDSQTVGTRIVEYDTSKTNLEAMISKTVTTFVYPYGQNGRSATTDRELWGRYDRIVNAGQPLGLACTPLDQRSGMFLSPRSPVWTTATHQATLAAVRLAAAQPIMMNIYAHRPGVDMTLAELDELLTLADTLGVPVLNFRDAYPAGGLLDNPGAEADTRGWGNTFSGTGGVFEVVTDTPESGLTGTKSFHITNPGDAQFLYAYQYAPIVEGMDYTFSGNGKVDFSSGAGYARLRVQPVDQYGQAVGIAYQTSDFTASTWTKRTIAFTAPAGSRAVRCDMIVLNKTGEAWFDHLHFGLTRDGVFG